MIETADGAHIVAFIRETEAHAEAQRYWLAYLQSDDGSLVFRIRELFREAGMTVPERIEQDIDVFTKRMMEGEAPATAFRLPIKKTCSKGIRSYQRQKIVEAVELLRSLSDANKKATRPVLSDQEIYRRVGKRFGKSKGAVEQVVLDHASSWERAFSRGPRSLRVKPHGVANWRPPKS